MNGTTTSNGLSNGHTDNLAALIAAARDAGDRARAALIARQDQLVRQLEEVTSALAAMDGGPVPVAPSGLLSAAPTLADARAAEDAPKKTRRTRRRKPQVYGRRTALIRAALLASPAGMTRAELRRATGLARTAIIGALGYLRHTGEVASTGDHGAKRYALVVK